MRTRLILFIGVLFIGLGILLIVQAQSLNRTKLIFCDVGQGDAILVQAGTTQILIDAGPGTKIVECLSRYMPFWDRKVEMIIATHPQKDHMEGFVEVLARYEVANVVSTGVQPDNQLYETWEKAVADENAKTSILVSGNKIAMADVSFDVLWPTRQSIESWKASPPKDLNDSSIVLRLNFGQTCAYLTGDLPKELLEGLIDGECEILKVSHHGSKTGTNEAILAKARPKVAVIQVGKNSYGHPTREVLNMLEAAKVRVLRNDLEGTVELEISNGSISIR